MTSKTIEDIEQENTILTSEEFSQHIQAIDLAFSTILIVLRIYQQEHQDTKPSAGAVCATLLGRIASDLRCLRLLAERLYVSQAMTMASTIYEKSIAILLIRDSEEEANRWLNHQDRGSTYNVKMSHHNRKRISEFFGSLADCPEFSEAIFIANKEIYRQTCMSKHSNPIEVLNLCANDDKTEFCFGGILQPLTPVCRSMLQSAMLYSIFSAKLAIDVLRTIHIGPGCRDEIRRWNHALLDSVWTIYQSGKDEIYTSFTENPFSDLEGQSQKNRQGAVPEGKPRH